MGGAEGGGTGGQSTWRQQDKLWNIVLSKYQLPNTC